MNNVSINPNISALVEEVLDRLEPRLRHLARRQIAKAPEVVELNADDLFQEMNLQILERVNRENNFLIQTDAYISQYGLWAAMNHIRRIRAKYSSWHVVETEDCDELCYCKGRAGPDPSTAVEAREIYALLDKCPTDYQTVWALLSKGYTYTEVGKLMGKSVYAIGTRKKKLVHVIREAYNAPLSHKSAVLEKLR
jgi:RNA polymerase sigma factor (sigma-70 family)